MTKLLLSLMISTVASATHINFASSTARGPVTDNALRKLVTEAETMFPHCCRLYGRHCNDKISYDYQGIVLDTGDMDTKQVLATLPKVIKGRGTKVLLGAYATSGALGSANHNGAVIFKRADGIVFAHELGHTVGLGHSGDRENLMAPGYIMTFYPKPPKEWCERL